MEVIAYIASIFVGISLGLIGGGGSILMLPIFVYLFKIDEVVATSYSLLVVGVASFVAAVQKYFKKEVDFRSVAMLGFPTLITIFLVRKFLVPAIPIILFEWKDFLLTKNIAILSLFALLMLAAAWSMLKNNSEEEPTLTSSKKVAYPFMILSGIAIGLLTGLVGAGGGFLLIPALVYFAKLPMKTAIGTSLSIIAINSFVGFMGDWGTYPIETTLLLTVIALALVGIVIGNYLSNYIPGKKLKPAFAWFILVMALYILTKELILN